MQSGRGHWERGATIVALACLIVPAFIVLWPWLTETQRFGFHDWDVMTSHRYLAVASLRDHGELPGWNPYACGGFPAWGYVEGATNVVSPFLPLYWWLDIRMAIRLEVLGMALLGAWGSYLAAGTVSESRGARALVAVLFATNGRFGLQAASGHGWHLAYAILPWVFYCFERARVRPLSPRFFAGLAVSFAMLIYAGGIYPLPHTLLFVGAWAVGLAIIERSARPLVVLSGAGAAGALLAAPKLLPVLAAFARAPRVIESNERLGPGALLTLLVSRQQAFFDRPAAVTPYGWHEWGMYVSVLGVALLLGGLVFARGSKAWLLKGIAVV
ncbi:MAG: hypothetical protein JNK04_15940, partial [Myxococcales bacterium]|nr:hypothetical protein [Myxococcales bacterium]